MRNNVNGLVPEPPLTPAMFVNVPTVVPVRRLPTASEPETDHSMAWPFANWGEGVQVRTVLPPLQTGTAPTELPAWRSRNVAVVFVGFIAALKVNTIGAYGWTPEAVFVGLVETMVTAEAGWTPASRATMAMGRKNWKERIFTKLLSWPTVI